MVTDGTGDIALATEKGHADMIDSPPRKANEGILTKKYIPFIAMFVIIMSIGDIGLFYYSIRKDYRLNYRILFECYK